MLDLSRGVLPVHVGSEVQVECLDLCQAAGRAHAVQLQRIKRLGRRREVACVREVAAEECAHLRLHTARQDSSPELRFEYGSRVRVYDCGWNLRFGFESNIQV